MFTGTELFDYYHNLCKYCSVSLNFNMKVSIINPHLNISSSSNVVLMRLPKKVTF